MKEERDGEREMHMGILSAAWKSYYRARMRSGGPCLHPRYSDLGFLPSSSLARAYFSVNSAVFFFSANREGVQIFVLLI